MVKHKTEFQRLLWEQIVPREHEKGFLGSDEHKTLVRRLDRIDKQISWQKLREFREKRNLEYLETLRKIDPPKRLNFSNFKYEFGIGLFREGIHRFTIQHLLDRTTTITYGTLTNVHKRKICQNNLEALAEINIWYQAACGNG
jgi:hypothetical protein